MSQRVERAKSLLEAAQGTKHPDAFKQLVSHSIAQSLIAIAEAMEAAQTKPAAPMQ
jgi:AmiR/NasT family two-component response regulator